VEAGSRDFYRHLLGALQQSHRREEQQKLLQLEVAETYRSPTNEEEFDEFLH
jgi:hypothetical protein